MLLNVGFGGFVSGDKLFSAVGVGDDLEAVRAITQTADATITSNGTGGGDWSATGTWTGGVVPGDNDKVIIEAGDTVTYDVDNGLGVVELSWIRVDGVLTFDPLVDTTIVVETVFVETTGTLTMGTTANPIGSSVACEWIFRDTGPIDVANDTALIGRGILVWGDFTLHGDVKTSFEKVASDPSASDTSVTLASAPTNWQVGDTIVIANTKFVEWGVEEDRDEVRTITAVNGAVITFTPALTYDHDTPRADLKCDVANLSRNLLFRSETTATARRGHIMVHKGGSYFKYAEFKDMGRTDKNVPSGNVFLLDTVSAATNVQGRYPFHFHFTLEQNEDLSSVQGCSVHRSPGWGFAVHSSNADIFDCVAFDCVGACFVTEEGDELGAWYNNLAVYSKGYEYYTPNSNVVSQAPFTAKNTATSQLAGAGQDLGRNGVGFWFQGRLVECEDNRAASCGTGFQYFHRVTTADLLDVDWLDQPEAFGYVVPSNFDKPIIHDFDGNEAYSCFEGFNVIKNSPLQTNNLRSVFHGFTAWDVYFGARADYTAHYTFRDFDLIATQNTNSYPEPAGISTQRNAHDMIIIDSVVDGFAYGYQPKKDFTPALYNPSGTTQAVKFIDSTAPNSTKGVYKGFDADLEDEEIASGDITPVAASLTVDSFVTQPRAVGTHPFYDDSLSAVGNRVFWKGTKTDSLGSRPYPLGIEYAGLTRDQALYYLNNFGYWQAAGGEDVIAVEHIIVDRYTDLVEKFNILIELDPNLNLSAYTDNGTWDFTNDPPSVTDETDTCAINGSVTTNVLSNDSDPDVDTISIRGTVPPRRGDIVDNGDGTITYTPRLGWGGTEAYYYWVTDSKGGYTRGKVTVTVS